MRKTFGLVKYVQVDKWDWIQCYINILLYWSFTLPNRICFKSLRKLKKKWAYIKKGTSIYLVGRSNLKAFVKQISNSFNKTFSSHKYFVYKSWPYECEWLGNTSWMIKKAMDSAFRCWSWLLRGACTMGQAKTVPS